MNIDIYNKYFIEIFNIIKNHSITTHEELSEEVLGDASQELERPICIKEINTAIEMIGGDKIREFLIQKNKIIKTITPEELDKFARLVNPPVKIKPHNLTANIGTSEEPIIIRRYKSDNDARIIMVSSLLEFLVYALIFIDDLKKNQDTNDRRLILKLIQEFIYRRYQRILIFGEEKREIMSDEQSSFIVSFKNQDKSKSYFTNEYANYLYKNSESSDYCSEKIISNLFLFFSKDISKNISGFMFEINAFTENKCPVCNQIMFSTQNTRIGDLVCSTNDCLGIECKISYKRAQGIKEEKINDYNKNGTEIPFNTIAWLDNKTGDTYYEKFVAPNKSGFAKKFKKSDYEVLLETTVKTSEKFCKQLAFLEFLNIMPEIQTFNEFSVSKQNKNQKDLSDIFKYSSVRRLFQNSDSNSDYTQNSTTPKMRGGGVGNLFDKFRQSPSRENRGGGDYRRNIPILQTKRCGVGSFDGEDWSEVNKRRTTRHNPIKQIIEYNKRKYG